MCIRDRTTWWDNTKKRKDNATLLIAIIACVAGVCACGCLAYARCVRPAKKKTPALSHPTTTTNDPTRLHEVHGRMVGWYEAPAQAALRQRWGPFPTPELLETWPGFVRVTNAFMDARDGPECATPVAVQVARPEVARPVEVPATAPFATVVNVQRVVRGWSARGLQRLASWRATPEEEV